MEYIFIPIPSGLNEGFYLGADLMVRNSDGVTGEVYLIEEGWIVQPISALMDFEDYSEIVVPSEV
jgi:hypothetical protein